MSQFDNPYAPSVEEKPQFNPPGMPPPMSVMAILSLVSGIISTIAGLGSVACFCCLPLIGIGGPAALLTGIGGAVLGYLGMKECANGAKSGRGLAMAGMITGIIGAVLGAIGLLAFLGLFALGAAQQPPAGQPNFDSPE